MQQWHPHRRRRRQPGLSLIELLVGLAIGLLTIAVAIGCLVISRQLAATVSDASHLQQQAAQALRTIGQQARQAGALRLNLAVAKDRGQAVDAGDRVAFEAPPELVPISAKDGYPLALAYLNDAEHLVGSATAQSQLRDCLGQRTTDSIIHSRFMLDKAASASSGELRCAGSHGQREALIANVADFRVRFVAQPADATAASPTLRYHTSDSVSAAIWPRIQAVEVCLEMAGSQTLPDTGADYFNCAGQRVPRGDRLRMVLRNSFQIRSQVRP